MEGRGRLSLFEVVRRINFLPVPEGQLFGPLKDLTMFNAEIALPSSRDVRGICALGE